MPAAERVCRSDEEVLLWVRVMRAFGEVDDAEEVAAVRPSAELLRLGGTASATARNGRTRSEVFNGMPGLSVMRSKSAAEYS